MYVVHLCVFLQRLLKYGDGCRVELAKEDWAHLWVQPFRRPLGLVLGVS
jgi:hypothetical protein